MRKKVKAVKAAEDYCKDGTSCPENCGNKKILYYSSMQRHLEGVHQISKEEANYVVENMKRSEFSGYEKFEKKVACHGMGCRYFRIHQV